MLIHKRRNLPNKPEIIGNSGVVHIGISDHSLIFIQRKISIQRKYCASVWSENVGRIHRVAQQLEVTNIPYHTIIPYYHTIPYLKNSLIIHEQNRKEITTVAVVLYLIKHMWIITKLLLRFSRRIQHLC